MNNAKILKLDKAGLPRQWITQEQAAAYYAKEQVIWSLGEEHFSLTGGVNNVGQTSLLELAPIIACEGERGKFQFTPLLTNSTLFRRDNNLCLYCGEIFSAGRLTRDHVIPRVQKGKDIWTNVVTACGPCNNRKGGRTPEQAGMKLLAVPFVPNQFEYMYLANRHVREDQMEYLKSRFSGKRCWQAA